jgi:hypothetical protein
MSNITINPYELLKITNNASLTKQEVTEQFMLISKKYHPNNIYNNDKIQKEYEKIYGILCSCYKHIIKDIVDRDIDAPSPIDTVHSNIEHERNPGRNPERNPGRNPERNPERNPGRNPGRNQEEEQYMGTKGYTLGIDDTKYIERDTPSYLKNRDLVKTDLASNSNLFNNQDFNGDTFNEVFEKNNYSNIKTHGRPPEMLTSGTQGYSMIYKDDSVGNSTNLTRDIYSGVTNGYGRDNSDINSINISDYINIERKKELKMTESESNKKIKKHQIVTFTN